MVCDFLGKTYSDWLLSLSDIAVAHWFVLNCFYIAFPSAQHMNSQVLRSRSRSFPYNETWTMDFHRVAIGLLFLGSHFLAVSTTEVSFTGRGYIKYPFDSTTQPSDTGKPELIQLHFKTIHPNGVLLFSEGSSDDFIHLELEHGTIR